MACLRWRARVKRAGSPLALPALSTRSQAACTLSNKASTYGAKRNVQGLRKRTRKETSSRSKAYGRSTQHCEMNVEARQR